MKTLILLMLASTASDAYYTHRNLLTGRECNPIVRPFVASTRAQVMYFSIDASATISAAYLFRQRHHNRLGKSILAAEAVDHATGAAFSAANSNHKGAR